MADVQEEQKQEKEGQKSWQVISITELPGFTGMLGGLSAGEALARFMSERGVKPGEVVALCDFSGFSEVVYWGFPEKK